MKAILEFPAPELCGECPLHFSFNLNEVSNGQTYIQNIYLGCAFTRKKPDKPLSERAPFCPLTIVENVITVCYDGRCPNRQSRPE